MKDGCILQNNIQEENKGGTDPREPAGTLPRNLTTQCNPKQKDANVTPSLGGGRGEDGRPTFGASKTNPTGAPTVSTY